jgi:cyclohexadienyl dehydratase
LKILFLAASGLLVGTAHADPSLRVATSGDYAPFSSEEESGKLRGMDIDIAERLGRDLGMEIQFVRFAWPDLERKLEGGELDVAMSGITMRPDRAVAGLYTRPYALTGAVALVRSDGTIRKVADLERPSVRLVVNAGGHLERATRARFPRASVTTTTDNWSLAPQVREGKVDAAITDSAEVRQWLDRSLRALGPFTYDHKAFLLPAAQAALAERIDAWLAERERDGWLSELRARWLGDGAALDGRAMAREAVVALVELRLGLMPAVAAAKREAGLALEDPAQEERVLERARAAAGGAASRVEGVYRLLIEMAKSVQRQASAPSAPQPLDRLRAAIARIDDRLVPELRGAPPAAASAWQSILQRNLGAMAIEPAHIVRLANALAAK